MKKLIALCLVLFGCATVSIPPIPENADFGASPSNYKDVIENYFRHSLIDPSSMQINYRFAEPQKGWIPQPDNMFSTKKELGYYVCGTINAKNRYGGYTGGKPFFFGFQEGILVYELYPQDVEYEATTAAFVRQLCGQGS